MKKSHGFQFKQFFIAHDQCAMKVNTDGILLGATASHSNPRHILDLGTGTGLVAIMLAQRYPSAQISALEVEPNAFLQAVENGKNSPFFDRLQIQQGDVLRHDFTEKFDLIVSNPPYFADSLTAKTAERDLARNAIQSHLDWLMQAKNWLAEKGKMTFILPVEAGEKLITQTPTSGLFCTEIWHISTKQGNPPKRMIATFSPENIECKHRYLAIYDEQNQYTADYRRLTQDFYLNF